MAIDITEAMMRSLAAVFAAPYPLDPGVATPDALVNGNIAIGWSDQRDVLRLPIIEIDAPISGEAPGRTATVTAKQRVDDNGDPSSDPADPNFLWTIVYGNVDLALMVAVRAETKHERSLIDFAVETALVGDPNGAGGLAESPPNADYFNQVFTFQQAGTARHVDNATSAGRDEWSSVREITGYGCRMFQYISASFTDLSIALKVTEMGRDFALVPSEDILIFDSTTP